MGLMKLSNFELVRSGNQVTAQWKGSPKFFFGVLSTLTESQALESAALSFEQGGVRPGTTADQINECVAEIRLRARVLKP